MQDVRERLLFFIKCQNLSNQAFEKKVGLSNGSVAKTKRLGDDKINKILDIYPNLNRIWLLTGEGEMLNTPTSITATNNGTIGGDMNVAHLIEKYPTDAIKDNEITEQATEEIPIIPKVACIEPNVDTLRYVQQNDVTTSPIVHQFPTSDVWYPVFTDTMSPDYLPGDKVALFAYPRGEEEVLNNRCYVVDTKRNGTILCRLIKTEEGYIAKYRNPEYPNDFIRYSDVIRIYKVVGLLRVIM